MSDAEIKREQQCAHVRSGELPAVTRVAHDMIAGVPTPRAFRATEIELCALCSGMIAGTLIQLEHRGLLAT